MDEASRGALVRLRQEILAEVEEIGRLMDEWRGLDPETAPVRMVGSILHDFYNGVERVFRRIAEEQNGGLPEGETWHVTLLGDMALDLEGIRPAVIDRALREDLEEFLRFRHLFRNIYGFVLRRERLLPLARRLAEVEERFRGAIGAYAAHLSRLAGD